MVSTTVNWQQQPTRNPSSTNHTKPAKRPGQARPTSHFNSFFIRLHSLGILYAYGYIFGGATLFRAAANATAHWRWYHCGTVDTYRLLFFLLEGIVYGEAPCAVVVHTVCCYCWRAALPLLFLFCIFLVVVSFAVVIVLYVGCVRFFVHKYPIKIVRLLLRRQHFAPHWSECY